MILNNDGHAVINPLDDETQSEPAVSLDDIHTDIVKGTPDWHELTNENFVILKSHTHDIAYLANRGIPGTAFANLDERHYSLWFRPVSQANPRPGDVLNIGFRRAGQEAGTFQSHRIYMSPTDLTTLSGAGNIINIHVSPGGNDDNWGQNANNPVATLGRARDIAQMCFGTGVIRILLADGVYNIASVVEFTGISRRLEFVGNTADGSLVSLRFSNAANNCITITDVAGVVFGGITIIKTVANTDNTLFIGRTKASIGAGGLRIASTIPANGVGITISNGNLSTIDSRLSISDMNHAFQAAAGGFVGLIDVGGANNNIAYRAASGGIITRFGTMPGAATPIQEINGGIILN